VEFIAVVKSNFKFHTRGLMETVPEIGIKIH